jgi:hypothetical protein
MATEGKEHCDVQVRLGRTVQIIALRAAIGLPKVPETWFAYVTDRIRKEFKLGKDDQFVITYVNAAGDEITLVRSHD